MRAAAGKGKTTLGIAWFWALVVLALGVDFAFAVDSAMQHFARASQLALNGKIEEAVEEYRAGLALDPKSAAAHNNLAALYFQEHKFRDAAAAFQKAHDLRPEDPAISFNWGLALFNAGEPQAAIAPLNNGIADPQHALDARYLLGVCYFDLKQWAHSIQELEVVRRSRPDDEKVLFILAKDYHNAGVPAKSLDAAAQLLKTHPDSLYIHEMLGEAYDTASQPQKAEEEFKQAIAASPQVPELHLMLGYLYWRWKRYSEAVEPLQGETRISPNLAEPYFYLGDIALRNKQFGPAENYFRMALRLKPAYGEADLDMGRALAESGHYQDAIPFMRLAVERMPDREEAHYWLGKTLIQAGQKPEGEKELAEVEKLNRVKRQTASEILNQVVSPTPAGGPKNP